MKFSKVTFHMKSGKEHTFNFKSFEFDYEDDKITSMKWTIHSSEKKRIMKISLADIESIIEHRTWWTRTKQYLRDFSLFGR